MSKREILATRYGEMLDMITCMSIYNGSAKPKRKTRMTFAEIMELE